MTRVCVLGTGGAGLVAAVAAVDAGADVTVVEKGSRVGGTTALSGGTTWIPAVEGGRDDALSYLDSLSHGLIDPVLAETFVDTGPDFLAWVQERTPAGFHVVPGLPDYHPDTRAGSRRAGARTTRTCSGSARWASGRTGSSCRDAHRG